MDLYITEMEMDWVPKDLYLESQNCRNVPSFHSGFLPRPFYKLGSNISSFCFPNSQNLYPTSFW